MTDLPTKIIDIDQLRINRNIGKICKCDKYKRQFVVDTTNKRIICSCGAKVDPYDAILDLASNGSLFQQQIKGLLEQRKQIIDYKPWLLTIRNLEKKYRGKKMLPCCPRCDEPFYLEELKTWMGRPYAEARINKWKGE